MKINTKFAEDTSPEFPVVIGFISRTTDEMFLTIEEAIGLCRSLTVLLRTLDDACQDQRLLEPSDEYWDALLADTDRVAREEPS